MDDNFGINWTILYLGLLSFSSVSCLLTIAFAFKQRQSAVSAVQHIIYSLCMVDFVYSFCRWLFYMAELVNFLGVGDIMASAENGRILGIRSIYARAHGVNRYFVLIIAVIGDFALLSSAGWAILLAYELKRLITKTMDRGQHRERRVLVLDSMVVYGFSGTYAAAMFSSSFIPNKTSQDIVVSLLLAIEMGCVWLSFTLPAYCAVRVTIQCLRNRHPLSPASLLLYNRIKHLVLCYAFLVFPSCVFELMATIDPERTPVLAIGIGQALYYVSGGFETAVVGLSASCCFRVLRPMMPSSVHDHLVEKEMLALEIAPVEPPMVNPIFVYTDIEGSTALWEKFPQEMAEALSLHDDLLRGELPRHSGYEITTVGDAFQLAFHHVSDAVQWCLDVQQKLVKAKWPAALLKHEKACKVTNTWGHAVFNGLRVRMAIHKGDDALVCSKHWTTGKMTYMGISELIAREMIDEVQGGQIVISEHALTQLTVEKIDAMVTPLSSPLEESHSAHVTVEPPQLHHSKSKCDDKCLRTSCASTVSTCSPGNQRGSLLDHISSKFQSLRYSSTGGLVVTKPTAPFDNFSCHELTIFERDELGIVLVLYQVTPKCSVLAGRFPRRSSRQPVTSSHSQSLSHGQLHAEDDENPNPVHEEDCSCDYMASEEAAYPANAQEQRIRVRSCSREILEM